MSEDPPSTSPDQLSALFKQFNFKQFNSGPSYNQLGDHNKIIISPDMAPLFLNLTDFENLLKGRHPAGFSVPYVRTAWAEGQTPIQQEVKLFLEGQRRVALLTAPGGYGKTRLALELGRWAEHTLGLSAVVVEPDRHGSYAGHLHELPAGPLVILIDDAEKAGVPILLNELTKQAGLAPRTKVIALTRTTFLPDLQRALAPYGAVQVALPGLEKLTYEESCLLLQALEVYGEDQHERLHHLASGIPLFLILAVDMARAGQNYYRLPSAPGQTLLDLHLDDALQAMEHSGQDRPHAQRILGTLALLRRVRPETARDLACLTRLVDLPPMTVERVLAAGAEVGLLSARNGRYRYSYDLIMERGAVRFVPLAQAIKILGAFDSQEYGTDFSDILHAVCSLAFQRDEGLGALTKAFDLQLLSAEPSNLVSFVRNVMQPVMRTHPDVALNWAERLVYGQREVTELSSEFASSRSSHAFLISVVLKAVQPLARMPAFQQRVLTLVARASSLDDPQASGAARQVLTYAAGPQPAASRPLDGLPELLNIIQGWLQSSRPHLWELALVALEQLAKIEVNNTRVHPDSMMQIRITRSQVPLEWPPYTALYARVQDVVRALPDPMIHAHGGRIGLLLATAVSQAALADGPEQNRSAVQRWFEISSALLSRLGAVHARHLADKAQWLVRHRQDHRTPLAAQLLEDIHHLPGAAGVHLLCSPPSARDFLQGTDWEATLPLVHAARLALAQKVVGTLKANEFSQLVLRLEGCGAKPTVPGAIEALLDAELTYGLQVIQNLLKCPALVPQMIASLHNIFRHAPELARALANDVLERALPQELVSLLPFYVRLAAADGALEDRLLSLARHPDARIRAVMARSWATPKEYVYPILEAAMESGAVDEELGQAVLAGLQRCGNGLPVPAALARTFLDATLDLKLDDLDDHTMALDELGRSLSATDPLWLLGHLERRAEQLDPLELHWDEPRAWASLFSSSPADPAVLSMLLDRLWEWSLRDGGRLRRAAHEIFGRLGSHCPEQTQQFLLEKVQDTSDLDTLKKALSLAFALGDDVAGDVADAAIRQGSSPQFPNFTAALGQCLVSGFSSTFQFREGGGPWPKDERMLRLARHRLEAARQQLLLGDVSDGQTMLLWEGLEQQAQRNIRETLAEEQQLQDDELFLR